MDPRETAPADDAPRAGPLRRLAVGLALLVLPLALLLAATEGALWALGLGGATLSPPVGRGFDRDVAYLRPDPRRDGGYVTQLFGDDRDQAIPPRDGRRRVLLLGGSNTQLLPERVLAEALEELDPGGPGHEVVNLGRAGYGSARVLVLLQQALPALDPDAVLIYSGHNEFVEGGFRFEVESALGRAEPTPLLRAVTSLRSFRVLESALRPRLAPGDVDPADDAYDSITWAETLEVLEAYGANLRRMLAVCAERDVPAVLCTVVGNDWNVPRVSQLPPGTPDELAQKIHRSLVQVARAIPERLQLVPGQGAPERLRVGRWYGNDPEPWEPPRPPVYGGPLAETPAWSRDDPREDSVAGAHWPDPASWRSDVRLVVERAMAQHDPRLAEVERDHLRQAFTVLEAVLAAAPDHARALYLKGQVLWLTGRQADGAALLRRASARDGVPRRGNDTTNALVRLVASEHPDVPLHDAAERFTRWSPHGAVGYAVMMDGCHLQPGARRALLRDVAPTVLEALRR